MDCCRRLRAALSDYLSSEGITVLGKLAYQSVRKTAEGDAALTVLRDGVSETIVAERLLVAAGRTPNVEDLGLTEAGVTPTPSGAILVDDSMRNSVHGVYSSEERRDGTGGFSKCGVRGWPG